MEQKPNSTFISQSIKKRPFNRRKFLTKLIEVIGFSILFGVISSLTIAYILPILEEDNYPEDIPNISFTDEVEISTQEITPEEMIQEDKVETEIVVEEIVPLQQLEEMTSALKGSYQEWSKHMVTVSAVTNEVSFLDGIQELQEHSLGVIVADTGEEFLVLVDGSAIVDAEGLSVTFQDGANVSGNIYGQDSNSNLAIIGVSKLFLNEETLDGIEVAELGTSTNNALVGTIVAAVGSPSGVPGSVQYGMITSMNHVQPSIDMNYHLMYTDMVGVKEQSGFLYNLKGEIIAVLYGEEGTQEQLVNGIGISQLKMVIEKLSNQEEIPYIGLQVADIVLAGEGEESLMGAYVTKVELDSPAMRAGIQAGDIIVDMDGEIHTAAAYSRQLFSMEVGAQTSITIARLNQETYEEIELSVVIE